MFDLGEEQIVAIAMAIKGDVAAYIADHRAEYEAYLREIEREDAYTDEDAKALGA